VDGLLQKLAALLAVARSVNSSPCGTLVDPTPLTEADRKTSTEFPNDGLKPFPNAVKNECESKAFR
jgi:hypothetical protein